MYITEEFLQNLYYVNPFCISIIDFMKKYNWDKFNFDLSNKKQFKVKEDFLTNKSINVFKWLQDNVLDREFKFIELPNGTKMISQYIDQYDLCNILIYDERGNLLKHGNGPTIISRKFDDNNNLIAYEENNGHNIWSYFQKFEDNNLVYFENSTGMKQHYEYDQFSNLVYFQCNDYTYRQNWNSGKLLYYEDSKGFIKEYTYDDEGRIAKYEDSNDVKNYKGYDLDGNCTYFQDETGNYWTRVFDMNNDMIYTIDKYGHGCHMKYKYKEINNNEILIKIKKDTIFPNDKKHYKSINFDVRIKNKFFKNLFK